LTDWLIPTKIYYRKLQKSLRLSVRWLSILTAVVAGFTVFNTALVIAQMLPHSAGGGWTTSIGDFSSMSSSVEKSGFVPGFLWSNSYGLATGGWVFVGAVIWRGRIRSTWRRLGFEQDVFRLFTSTRGAGTRVALLTALSVPKDRLQLANELGTDWNVVDRHVRLLAQHGLIAEKRAYGRVKFYQTTESGKNLLELLEKSGGTSDMPFR
jgi:hypothetical protein